MLDECYGSFTVGEIPFTASQILSQLDPIAYDCGFSDFNDEELGEKQSELEDLESELIDFENSTEV